MVAILWLVDDGECPTCWQPTFLYAPASNFRRQEGELLKRFEHRQNENRYQQE